MITDDGIAGSRARSMLENAGVKLIVATSPAADQADGILARQA